MKMEKIKGLKKAISDYKKFNKDKYGKFHGVLYYDFENNEAFARELMCGSWIKYPVGSKIINLSGYINYLGFDEINTETAKLAICQFYNDPYHADFLKYGYPE